MKHPHFALGLLLTGALAAGQPAFAAGGTSEAGHADPAGERVVPNFAHALPTIPGKSLVAVEVSYAPGGASQPHHHAASAFIYAYVVSGSIASQVEGQPERVYHAGESFYEMPGAHHVVSRNASRSEPAKLLAVFVVDSGAQPLTTPDAQGPSHE